MTGLCDLHAHSTCSDGTFSPTELLKEAERVGLRAVALTDHNTLTGLPEFLEAGRNSEVETVPGIEFSTEYLGKELHILALFVKETHYEVIGHRLEDFQRRKEESNRALVAALAAAGMEIDYDAIRRAARGSVNRACIAAAMVKKGYITSVKQGCATVLSAGGGFYVPPKRPDALETVAFIRELGCVSVLAHPFLNLDEKQLQHFLPMAKEQGLVGMEVLYPMFSLAETELAAQMAARYGLLPSGGSDFHGKNKPHIALGRGTGDLRVPVEFLDALKKSEKFC